MDLFGSRTRTRILLYLGLVEESFPTEIARDLGATKLTVQRILNDLETLGVVASRLRGRVRVVTLNKRWYGLAELNALLVRMASTDPEIRDAVAKVRRRPRRAGKPL
jgi:DNA-binding transcriptional ArsR family regulator